MELVRQSPGLQRALALFRLDMRTEAVREWNYSLRGMSDRELTLVVEMLEVVARSAGRPGRQSPRRRRFPVDDDE